MRTIVVSKPMTPEEFAATANAASHFWSDLSCTPLPPPDPDPMPRRHVLLVDDHKTDVILAQAALELSGLDAQVNMRLNDIFFIATRHPGQQRAAYTRLRDKHVDFLVVAQPELRPVLALELDGDSHDNDAQRYRDAVKDVAFASAGLPLIRARAETVWTPEAIRSHIEGSMARR